jgi:DNA-binding NarL/FixJ family response regulator
MKCAAFGSRQASWARFIDLVGEGVNDGDIAEELDLTEAKVRGCVAWIVRFLELKNRQELVLYASTAA